MLFDLSIFSVGMENAVGEAIYGFDIVYALPDKVRGIEVQTEILVGDKLEKPLPMSEVLDIGGCPVFEGKFHPILFRVFEQGGEDDRAVLLDGFHTVFTVWRQAGQGTH